MPRNPAPRQRPGDDVSPLGATPPSDVTIGELWRTLTVMSRQIEHVAGKVEDLPGRISQDLGAKYDERLTAAEQRATIAHQGIDLRLQEGEVWRQETGPHVILLQERVAQLQRLVYGAVGSTLLAVLVAILSSVTHHS
jgi:hypothetical protein